MSRSFSQSIRSRVIALEMVSILCVNMRKMDVRVTSPSHLRRSLDRTEARLVRLLRMTVGVDTIDAMSPRRQHAINKLKREILSIVDQYFPEEKIDFEPYVSLVMDLVDSVIICIPREHRKVRNEWNILLGSISAIYRHMDPEWTHPDQHRVAQAGDAIARMLHLKFPEEYMVSRKTKRVA